VCHSSVEDDPTTVDQPHVDLQVMRHIKHKMGVLGIRNTIPMFATIPNIVNTCEIVLGGFGVLIGIFSRK